MEFLRIVRMTLLILIAIAAIWFAVMNPAERVRVELQPFGEMNDVPLVVALFYAFLLGLGSGLAIAFMRLVELQSKLRDARKARHRVEGELTTLRNLPLEETDESIPVTRARGTPAS
jgi:uncharacterized integral membrane protein